MQMVIQLPTFYFEGVIDRKVVDMEERHAFEKSILTGRRFLLEKNKYT